MRRVTLGVVLLLAGLFGRAFATDYELTLEPGAKALIKEQGLTIYEPYGLIKPGDHIVSVIAGPIPVPSMKCRVAAGLADNSEALATQDTQGFKGEIHLVRSDGPGNTYHAALLMHVVTPVQPKRAPSVVGNVWDFFTNRPWILILAGGLGLALLLLAAVRINAGTNGAPPIYGKRIYEENLRDVKSRLERILEQQEILVRKPPVLRTFRKQIDRFDKRLEKLELTAVTTQQALSVMANSVVEIQVSLVSLGGQNDRLMESVAALETTLNHHDQEAKSVEESLLGRLSEQAQSIDQVRSSLSQRIEVVSGAIKESEGVLAELRSDLAAGAEGQSELNSKLEHVQHELKQFEQLHASLSQLQNGLNDLGSKTTNAQQQLQSVREEHKAQAEAMAASRADVAELAKAQSQMQSDLAAQAASSAELKAALEHLQDSSAKSADLEPLLGLPESVEAVGKSVGSLSKGIDQVGDKVEKVRASVGEEFQSSLESRLGSLVETLRSQFDSLAQSEQVAGLEEKLEPLAHVREELDQVAQAVHGLSASSHFWSQTADGVAKAKSAIETLTEKVQGQNNADVVQSIEQQSKQLASSVDETRKAVAELSKALTALSNEALRHKEFEKTAGTLESKLSALQSLTAVAAEKSGKGEVKVAPESFAAFSELLEQLASETRKRENLEEALGGIKSSLDALPQLVSGLEVRLAALEVSQSAQREQPVGAVAPAIDLSPLVEQLVQLQNAVGGLPDQVKALESGLTSIAGTVETNHKSFAEVVNKISEAGAANASAVDSLSSHVAHLSERVTELPKVVSAPIVVEAPKAEPKKEERPAEHKAAHKEPAEKPAEKPEAPPMLHVEEFKPQEPAHVEEPVTFEAEEPLSVEQELVQEPAEPAASVEEEVEEDLAEIVAAVESRSPAAKHVELAEEDDPVEVHASASEDWIGAGATPAGLWTVSCKRELSPNDPAKVTKPLTPTETPGIEYGVGPMIYVNGRVIYTHGDVLRSFWPGKNERSLTLGHVVPDDHWRMLLLSDKLFCVQDHRVEIVDFGTWTRCSGFGGDFVAQSATKSAWVGIRSSKTPLLEFRDPMGEVSAKPFDLPTQFNENPFLVSDGKNVYVADKWGELYRASREGCTRLGEVGAKDSHLMHLACYQDGLLALFETPTGVVLKRLDADGKTQKEIKSDVKSVSGNGVVLGDKYFWFSPDRSQIVLCDLKNMRLQDAIDVLDAKRVRRMVGLAAGKTQALLVATSDEQGKLGSVFLLDPKSGLETALCSTNQPHVDVMFANGYAVVATSSSYQNIIRVFEPFKQAQEKAA